MLEWKNMGLLNRMKFEKNSRKLTIEKDDLIRFHLVEGQKPEIRIENEKSIEERFTLLFENHDTFEYFALKMNRILLGLKSPTVNKRIDSIRMKTILLNREFDKVSTKIKQEIEG